MTIKIYAFLVDNQDGSGTTWCFHSDEARKEFVKEYYDIDDDEFDERVEEGDTYEFGSFDDATLILKDDGTFQDFRFGWGS